LPGATIAELVAEPFDLVWVDLEHAALAGRDAQEVILGAQATGATALVRLPSDAYQTMATMLDAGADGIVLADVRSAETARAAIERVQHPPEGVRGWGPRRLSLRGRRSDREPSLPSVTAQIESVEGVENISSIAAVTGLDAVVVGTADLSFSLGVPLEMDAPSLLEAIDVVGRATREAGLLFGLAGAVDSLPGASLSGADLLIHSTDARVCASALDRTADEMRARLRDHRAVDAETSERGE
jgi:2-keto-3-deoxy-L-rhamnonate aldolase RhmA